MIGYGGNDFPNKLNNKAPPSGSGKNREPSWVSGSPWTWGLDVIVSGL